MPSPSGDEALRLAEASDWKGLQRLVERQPEAARAQGDYGMLPLHWACTEKRAPLALLLRLLAAHPQAARKRNAAELLPLHIAIRAGAHAAWLARLVQAFPEAISERTPSGESAIELAEAMRLDADRLKVLYRAEQQLASPEASSDSEELGGGNQDGDERDDDDDAEDQEMENQPEARGSRRSSRKSVGSAKKRQSNDYDGEQGKAAWPSPPSPFVGNGGGGGGGNRLSAATELSDVEVIEASSLSSDSGLSEGAVRLSASRDHLISPSSLSTSSNQFSPPNSVSAPVPLSSALYDASAYSRRHKSSRGQLVDREYADQQFASSRRIDSYRDRQVKSMAPQRPSGSEASDDRDIRSMISTSMGGRHQSLPIIPSFETGRRNSIGAFVEHSSRELGSESDDSDVNEEANGRSQNQQYYHSQPHRHSQQYQQSYDQQALSSGQHQQTQQRREFQTQPHPGKQRHHSPFAYRRASHGEVMLSSNGAHRRTFESPPEWRLDDECSICRVTFNMFKHRHHCRNCGKSICRQHSADKKIAMESKGFTTPQRVCITCYAMITQSRSLKHDLALDDLTGEPLLNSVAFQQQHYGTPGSSVGSPAVPMGAPVSAAMRPYATTTASMSTASSRRPSARSNSVAGGPSPVRNVVGLASTTLGMTTAGTTTANGSTIMASAMTPATMAASTSLPMEPATSKELALLGQLHELRAQVSSQQQQIEQLAQSNVQMQHQLLEQEELKAETTLLITQLMTRVSMLELRKDREYEEEEEEQSDGNNGSIVSK